MRFSRAIVRTPGRTFAQGITTAGLGAPDLGLALVQHEAYVAALRACGLEVTVLPPDAAHPDSTFVEDTAVLTAEWAITTRPGAASRAGEVESIREALRARFPALGAIEPPGTLDGGDICEAGGRFFLGLSDRTNEEGCAQLAAFLAARGHASEIVDIRPIPGLLHLKTGMTAVDAETLVVIDALANHPAFSSYQRIHVSPEEAYAANCVRVNDRVLIAAGFPKLEASLRSAGLSPLALEMSEFRKMDGGLSCLSLRF
jgi:dimethylargininase